MIEGTHLAFGRVIYLNEDCARLSIDGTRQKPGKRQQKNLDKKPRPSSPRGYTVSQNPHDLGYW